MECFMGCTPKPGSPETFYVMAMPELTIYGHTIDGWIAERYPEDADMIASGRRSRDSEWGCWHSEIEPDGEIGGNPASYLRPITYDAFMQASEQGWPYVTDLTTLAPVAAFAHVENGKLVWDWSSLDSVLGEKNQG